MNDTATTGTGTDADPDREQDRGADADPGAAGRPTGLRELAADRRARIWAGVLVGFAVFASLVLLASLPTGGDDPADVVPDGARLAAQAPVDDAHVLLLSESGRLRVQVAYRDTKGWLAASLGQRGDDVVAARTSTAGGGPVPALTAVFGRPPGDQVTVTWADGKVDEAVVESDGAFLVARAGVHDSESVVVRRDGEIVVEVPGP